MNILYGVAGVGFGHSSRARTIIDYLQKKGHKVKIITYGQGYSALKNDFDVFKAHGPNIIFRKGLLKKRMTLKVNAKDFPKNIWRWRKFKKLISGFRPDICITDMDPITAILSKLYHLPLISVDNQHLLTNVELKVPKNYYKDFFVAKNVVKAVVNRADAFLILNFTNRKTEKPNTFLVPPVLRKNIIEAKPRKENKILVYLSRKDSNTLNILRKSSEQFVVYGYDKNTKNGNLEFKTRETFSKDLQNCKAVVATAGFTLICESLFLKKPYFALPLKGQFEQLLNSIELKKSGYGSYSENLTSKEISDFVSNLKKYETKLARYKPDNSKLFKVLDKQLEKLKK